MKNRKEMKIAQHYLKDTASGETRGGFNSRLQDIPLWKCMGGIPNGSRWGERNAGWTLADEMIRAGKIFSRFERKDKKATLKSYLDGNRWCCVDLDFTNLQESNSAWGCTQAESIEKYFILYV